MIDDPLRTRPLVAAVKKSVRKGSRVVDIGTGLGILAIEAAKAGASEVFAIDCDAQALDAAFANAKKAGVADKIKFIEGLSFDVELPERADLIICETVGSFAFDENILATISDAKRRLTKRGGKIIPGALELWGAPSRICPKLGSTSEIALLKADHLLAKPVRMESIEFGARVPSSIHLKHKFRCRRSGMIRAIALWPRVEWCRGEITDASPLAQPTHWKQGILPIDARNVLSGQIVEMELIIGPHPDDPRRMTERLWRWIR